MRNSSHFILTLSLCLPLAAQSLPETFAKHWKTSVTYTRAMADKMPADGYSFKPTPPQMSFGEQVLHIANANASFAAAITGGKALSWDSKKADRASALAALDESAKLATAAIAKLTPEQLQKTVKSEEGEMRVEDLVLLMFDHTTHHRGQMVVYLRLKGIPPADYNF
jgi:uncharacterized damage-inducible protein DinB